MGTRHACHVNAYPQPKLAEFTEGRMNLFYLALVKLVILYFGIMKSWKQLGNFVFWFVVAFQYSVCPICFVIPFVKVACLFKFSSLLAYYLKPLVVYWHCVLLIVKKLNKLEFRPRV